MRWWRSFARRRCDLRYLEKRSRRICEWPYGVMSYTVSERTSEIGIRMALGARRSDVTAMILRKAVKLLAVGLVERRFHSPPRARRAH